MEGVPGVLILSFGEVTPSEIAENILSAFGQEKYEKKSTSWNTTCYSCNVKTKYYDTNICLIPWNDVNNVPQEFLQFLEAVIVYFEPLNKTILHYLQDVMKVINDNNIELGLLVTSKFTSLPSEISYEELKKKTQLCLDIITLHEEGTNQLNVSSSENYCQIVEALKNNVWRNLKFPTSKKGTQNVELDDSNLERELESFENLVSSVRNLRRTEPHLTRDQFMDQAEQLATMLSKVMNESDSD